jgi:hypothetical protein
MLTRISPPPQDNVHGDYEKFLAGLHARIASRNLHPQLQQQRDARPVHDQQEGAGA